MEQPLNLEFLSNLSEKQLRPIVESAIKTNGLEVVKKVLSLNKLNFEVDFVEVATKLNNKVVLDLLNAHQKLIQDKLIEDKKLMYNKFKDILSNDYQSLNPESLEAKQDLLLYDYFNEIRSRTKANCTVYPNNNKVSDCVESKWGFNSGFDRHTNYIFKNVNWNNMVIAGGFINNLLCNFSDMFSNSDINIFVYGPTIEIIKNKCDELFKYLQQFNPVYMIRNSLIHIIISKVYHIIQIIPKIANDPIEIINNFDFNYVKMYYDGKDVHTTIGGLIACRYNLATLDKITTKNMDDRIYKTLQKGYTIKYDTKLKNCSTIVKDHHIDTKLFNSQHMDVDHENFLTISKMLCTLEKSKHEGFVKLIFDKDYIVDAKTALENIMVLEDEKVCESLYNERLYINDLTLQQCAELKLKCIDKSYKYFLNEKEVTLHLRIDLTPEMYTHDNGILSVKLSDYITNLVNMFSRSFLYTIGHAYIGNRINIVTKNNVINQTVSINLVRIYTDCNLRFILDS